MQVKIVSFNIRCANDKDGHSVAERAPRLKTVLDGCDADIIGLQEYVDSWVAPLEDYAATYEMHTVWRDTRPDGWKEAAPLLWKRDRFTCLEKGRFWLSPTPEVESGREWDSVHKCNRICMWAKLQDTHTGQTLLAMNTHFGFGDEGQVCSARLIAERYALLGEGLPMVITGDFNMRPTYPAYAEMCAHFTDLNAGDDRITFHGYGVESKSEHIDYCFATTDVKATRVTLLDQTFDGKYPSDHYGLYFEVEV